MTTFQRRCYQFEAPNGWRVMEEMSEARHYAAAVLDERGDLWGAIQLDIENSFGN